MANTALVCFSLVVFAGLASGFIQPSTVSKLNHYITLMKSKVSPANNFQFTNCGGPEDLATFKSLVISPDPLAPPGQVNVSFEFDVHQKAEGKLDLNVTFAFKVDGTWYEVPCVLTSVGSCFYPNICPYLDYMFERCPLSFQQHGIPCKCPLEVGNYKLPTTSYYLPEGLDTGDYLLKLVLKQEGQQVACAETIFSFQ